MGYTKVALLEKILGIYPEIQRHGISVSVDFDDDKEVWAVVFQKDGHELTSILDKSDVDECIAGRKCVHLGVKIGEFVDNFQRP